MDIDRAMDSFIAYCRVERGLSANTILAYSTDLQHFAAWLTKPGIAEITPEILDFLRRLHQHVARPCI